MNYNRLNYFKMLVTLFKQHKNVLNNCQQNK